MRQIKFRAWDEKTKEIVEIDRINFNLGYAYYVDSKEELERVRLENCIQFTGLQDKNGKEIYEGDVVELNNSKYDIVFIEGEFCGANDNGESIQMFEVINGSVIGNIYEHSELLTNS